MVSWEARYPGAVRALNADLFDAYLLKSLDGAPAAAVHPETTAIIPCGPNKEKKCLFPYHSKKRKPELDGLNRPPEDPAVTLGIFCLSNEWAHNFVTRLDKDNNAASEFYDLIMSTKEMVSINLWLPERYSVEDVVQRGQPSCEAAQLTVPLSFITADNVDDFAEFGRQTGGPYPLTYDHVILCLGWHHDLSIYADAIKPTMQPNKKYAVMTEEYEAINTPGLYFGGALAHGKDYKRSAGGFIHGLRYTARALFHILEAKYEATPWPETVFTLTRDGDTIGAIAAKTTSRIDNADAPYQMVGTMGDGIVLECSAGGDALVFRYLEDVPVAYFNSVYRNESRFLWTFGYDGQRRSLTNSVKDGTLFEVHLWEFEGACDPHFDPLRPAEKSVAVLHEQLHVEWDTQFNRIAIQNMLAEKTYSIAVGKNVEDRLREMGETENLHRRERSVTKKIAPDDWLVGDVYIWAINDLELPVQISPANGALDKFAVIEGRLGSGSQDVYIDHGRGKQLYGVDGQKWLIQMVAADGQGTPLCESVTWMVDVSKGKVQDVLMSDLLKMEGDQCHADPSKKSSKKKRFERLRKKADAAKAKAAAGGR